MIGLICILMLILLGDATFSNKRALTAKRRIYCSVVFGAMFLFAALRGESVGLDTHNRYEYYAGIFSYGFKEFFNYLSTSSKDVAYDVVIWLISRIFPSAYLIETLMNTFVLFSFAAFFYRYSEDITLSVLMFFAFFFGASLNINRQYVAAAFSLWAIRSIIKNQKIKSFIWLCLAASIHISAIVMFAVYVLYLFRFQLSQRILLVMSLGAVAAFLLFDVIIDFVITYIFPQYWWYTTGSWAVGDISFSVLWLVIYSLLIFLVGRTLPRSFKRKARIQNGVIIGRQQRLQCIVVMSYLLYALVSLLQSKIWFLSRMNTYFGFGYAMVVAQIFTRFPGLSKKSAKFVRVAFLLLLSIWAVLMYAQNTHGLFPYVFAWA